MFPPEQSGESSEQQYHANAEPHEQPYASYPQQGQQHYQTYQEQSPSSNTYENGYRGYSYGGENPQGQPYDGPYRQQFQEKLRPHTERMTKQQRNFVILIILLLACASGTMGTLFNAISGAISGGFGILIVGFIIYVALATREVQLPTRTFTVTENPTLRIHNDAGSVRFWRGENNKVEIRATKHVSRVFENNGSTETPVEYNQNGNAIAVNVLHWSSKNFFNVFRVTMDVYLPEHCEIRAESNAGSFTITGLDGHVNARTNAGTIRVEQSNLGPGSDLRTNAGTLNIQQSTIQRGTTIHTNAGTVHVEQTALKGGASLSTNAGTVYFDGTIEPGGDYQLKSNAGTIHVALPANSSFTLSAQTNMGTITNEFGSDIVGPDPKARLNLRTDMGTIHVERR
jgi:hypothetical protein